MLRPAAFAAVLGLAVLALGIVLRVALRPEHVRLLPGAWPERPAVPVPSPEERTRSDDLLETSPEVGPPERWRPILAGGERA